MDSAATALCFHCGEAVPKGEKATVCVHGEVKPVCCAGCQAVAELVLNAGLDNFYQYRDKLPQKPASPSANNVWQHYDQTSVLDSISYAIDSHHREAVFSIDGLYCAACVWLLERVLQKHDGVLDIQINPATSRMQIHWDQDRVPVSQLLADIARLGYEASPLNAKTRMETAQQITYRKELRRLVVAGVGMMQVMMYAVALYMGAFQGMDSTLQSFLRWFSFLIATPVVFYAAQPFFKNALYAAFNKKISMDTPIALAIGLAYVGSVVSLFFNSDEIYFDSVVMFTFFLLLGRFAKNQLRQRIANQADAISKLSPLFAQRVSHFKKNNESIEAVPLSDLQIGDVVSVNAGDVVPIDGSIIEGVSSINEALITGEAKPLNKKKGDLVVAGSVNIEGVLYLCVTKPEGQSQLSKINYLFQKGQTVKPDTDSFADKIAPWFSLSVLVLAFSTGIVFWVMNADDAFVRMLSVLIVSCPCALSLGTPVALTVASSHLLKNKILVTQADAIETLSAVKHIVFDKTGTLTNGKPTINNVILHTFGDKRHYLGVAAALESGINHPVAAAFLDYKRDYSASNVKYTVGSGVEAFVNGRKYRMGTRKFVSGTGEGAESSTSDTHVYLSDENNLLCEFVLTDKLRLNSKFMIDRLLEKSLKLHIVSGDMPGVVDNICRLLTGNATLITTRAQANPEDKLAYIKALQTGGNVVAMLGDGANDAPVLAGANASIAMHSGTMLAQSAADIVLLDNDLSKIPMLMNLAQTTKRIIKQNIFWALAYNATAIPLAVMGYVPPWLAAIGMSLSSLFVLLNSLRLTNAKKCQSMTTTHLRLNLVND